MSELIKEIDEAKNLKVLAALHEVIHKFYVYRQMCSQDMDVEKKEAVDVCTQIVKEEMKKYETD